MSNREQLMGALRNAHSKGDKAGAKRIAGMMQTSPTKQASTETVAEPPTSVQESGFMAKIKSPAANLQSEHSYINNAFSYIRDSIVKATTDDGINSILNPAPKPLKKLDRERMEQSVANPDRIEPELLEQYTNALQKDDELKDKMAGIEPVKPEISLGIIWEAMKKDPGGMLAEVVNGAMADPELLFIPIGYAKAAERITAATVKMGAVASKTAGVAAGVATSGGLTGGIVAAGAAARELNKDGDVALSDIADEVKVATVAGGALGAMAGTFQAMKRGMITAAKETGKTTLEISSTVRDKMAKVDNLDTAYEAALRESGVSEATIAKTMNRVTKGMTDDVMGPPKPTPKKAPKIEDTPSRPLDYEDVIMRERELGYRALEGKPSTAMSVAWEKALAKKRLAEFTGKPDVGIPPAWRNIRVAQEQAGKANLKALVAAGAVAGTAIGLGTFVAKGGDVEEAVTMGLAIGGVALGAKFLYSGLPPLTKALRWATKTKAQDTWMPTKAPNKPSIAKFAEEAEGAVAGAQRTIYQFKSAVDDLVPDKADRVAISHYLEGDDAIVLTPDQVQVAGRIKSMFDELGKVAVREGVIDSLLDYYVPHLWRRGLDSDSAIMDKLLNSGGGSSGSPKTMHNKARTIPTLAEGKADGLIPATEDIAEILSIYSNSIHRAIANKRLIKAIKDEVTPNGTKYLVKAEKAPKDYVTISHPQLMGMAIHPDIKGPMQHIFNTNDASVLMQGASAINFAMKRGLVMASLFHAKALLESSLMSGNGFKGQLNQLVRGSSPALQTLRRGKAGDEVDKLLRAGLKIGIIEDSGTSEFYGGMHAIQDILNKRSFTAPGASVIKGVEKVNRIYDTVTWDRIMTGNKIQSAMAEMSKARLDFPHIPEEQLLREVAEYVNDAYGGLNWTRLAQGVDERFGGNIGLVAQQLLSPKGRKVMQLGMFAPDWTIANIRVIAKAFPGVTRNPRIRAMHQRYAYRGLMMFMIGANAINQVATGRYIWENEDPLRVDLGTGQTMQFSKQLIEPAHWVTHPGATLVNKAGILPKWFVEQLTGVAYINPKNIRHSPSMYPKDSNMAEQFPYRVKHTAEKFVPIWAQQTYKKGVMEGVAGWGGFPVYGQER